MITYKKVDIPHYDTIVDELKEYTKKTHPYLYSGISWTGKKMDRAAGKHAQKLFERAMIEEKIKNEHKGQAGFWRQCYPDIFQDTLEKCPHLSKGLAEYGNVVNVAFFCMWDKHSPIHSDDIVMDLQTQRYRMDPAMEEYYDKFPPFPIRTRINIPLFNCEKWSSKWWQPHVDKPPKRNDFRSYQEDECDLINETVLDKTMLIRVDIPHQVVNHSWRFPRMAATISTDKDLTPFLENYERWEDPLGYGY